jgi:hypothetical protein
MQKDEQMGTFPLNGRLLPAPPAVPVEGTYSLGEQRLTHELREGVAGLFHEDEPVLQAQQQAVDERPGQAFQTLKIDAGAMWARRLIEHMVAAESQGQRFLPLRPAA